PRARRAEAGDDRVMKRVFVTGGSGFVGGALVRHLVARGIEVHALARSQKAIDAVRALGATPVKGELEATPAVVDAMRGCEVVFHAAAHTEDWGDEALAWRVTVGGTAAVLRAAKEAGVPRFVHVGSEAALVDGTPIVRATEERPLPERPIGI